MRGTRIQAEAKGDYREGIRWQIVVVPDLGHRCAYVGIPADSPRAGIGYDDVPIPVHGGWTYSEEGDGEPDDAFPKGWYWWGWDYAHFQDYSPGIPSHGGHFWTLEEVRAEVDRTLPLFEEWLRSSESKAG